MDRVVVLLLISTTPVLADEPGLELLASFDQREQGRDIPEDDFRVQVILQHELEPSVWVVTAELGRGVWWRDGASGILDFHSGNHPEFEEFAHGITDGVDDVIRATVGGPGREGGAAAFESFLLGGSPDLIGNEIDFIRLIINDVSIEPYSDPFAGDGMMWDVDLTAEFWGRPIPEPATIALLALGGLTLLGRGTPRHRRRRVAIPD